MMWHIQLVKKNKTFACAFIASVTQLWICRLIWSEHRVKKREQNDNVVATAFFISVRDQEVTGDWKLAGAPGSTRAHYRPVEMYSCMRRGCWFRSQSVADPDGFILGFGASVSPLVFERRATVCDCLQKIWTIKQTLCFQKTNQNVNRDDIFLVFLNDPVSLLRPANTKQNYNKITVAQFNINTSFGSDIRIWPNM